MPSALVLVQFPRRIRVSSEAVEAEIGASERPTPVHGHRPSLGAASSSSRINNDPEQQPSTPSTGGPRSRLIRQATVQFGAETLQKTSPIRSSAFTATAAADEANTSAPSVAPSAGGAGRNGLPSGVEAEHCEAMEREEEVTIEVEAMVRAMIKEFLDAGYLQGYPTWTSCLDGKYMNAIFTCHADLATLVVLKLEYIGIGSDVGAVNAAPVQVGRSAIHARRLAEERKKEQRILEERRQLKESKHRGAVSSVEHDSTENLPNKSGEKAMVSKLTDAMSDVKMSARKHWGRFFIPDGDSKFMNAASAFRVEELAEQISGMALFTFDYIMFVIIASVIAAVGLATDNSVVVVAAMLVSPIMGPIMAFTFGTATRDWGMVGSGLAVEALSLFMCVVVGFLYGVGSLDNLEEGEWPTEQMFSRAGGPMIVMSILVHDGLQTAQPVPVAIGDLPYILAKCWIPRSQTLVERYEQDYRQGVIMFGDQNRHFT